MLGLVFDLSLGPLLLLLLCARCCRSLSSVESQVRVSDNESKVGMAPVNPRLMSTWLGRMRCWAVRDKPF